MARVVICPSCQYQGSIPDDVKPKRIRCPKCKETFDVASATQSECSARETARATRGGTARSELAV